MFSPLQTREKGLPLEAFRTTPVSPRLREGKEKSKCGVSIKFRPGKTCFPLPLLKISPISLEFGKIALKTIIYKTIAQMFDIFHFRWDIGFQTWSNHKTRIKCRPGKTCSPPLLNWIRFYSILAWLLSRHSFIKMVTTFLVSYSKAKILAPKIQEIWVHTKFWLIFYILPHQPP